MEQKKPVKTTPAYGSWIYKKTISTVVVCACGNKYLKTRPRQQKCLECMRNG